MQVFENTISPDALATFHYLHGKMEQKLIPFSILLKILITLCTLPTNLTRKKFNKGGIRKVFFLVFLTWKKLKES